MSIFVYTSRFLVALATASLIALLVQLAFSISPVDIGSQDADLSTLLLTLVVLNLATVVAFVVTQTRVLGWLLARQSQPLIVISTICGPVAAMAGYVLGVQLGNAPHAVTILPFLVGQAVLWLRLRRTVDSSLEPSDASSQRTP